MSQYESIFNSVYVSSINYKPITLDDYILQNAKNIHRADALALIKKWRSYIDRNFNDIYLNKELLSNLSIYIELCYSYYKGLSSDDICTSIDDICTSIRSRIKKDISHSRTGVVRKVFNYETGFMEYELEDGNFITINESVIPPKIEVDNGIFPPSFVKLIDKEKYRDIQIDEIL